MSVRVCGRVRRADALVRQVGVHIRGLAKGEMHHRGAESLDKERLDGLVVGGCVRVR